jgi:hypothetical protein
MMTYRVNIISVGPIKLDSAFNISMEYFASEAEPKEKHGVWDPMPELTITSPYVHSRVDSSTYTMVNPMPESTLSPSQGLWICFLDFYSEILNLDVNTFSLIYQSLRFHGVYDNGNINYGLKSRGSIPLTCAPLQML